MTICHAVQCFHRPCVVFTFHYIYPVESTYVQSIIGLECCDFCLIIDVALLAEVKRKLSFNIISYKLPWTNTKFKCTRSMGLFLNTHNNVWLCSCLLNIISHFWKDFKFVTKFNLTNKKYMLQNKMTQPSGMFSAFIEIMCISLLIRSREIFLLLQSPYNSFDQQNVFKGSSSSTIC